MTHHTSLASLERYSRCIRPIPWDGSCCWSAAIAQPELFALSDDICTGLQLANFYQDIGEDFDRGRRYIPVDAMERFHITEDSFAAQVRGQRADENFRAMMRFLIEDARARLHRGARIVKLVDRDLAATLSLFVAGGNAILDAIAAQHYDTLQHRPEVSKGKKFALLGGALRGKLAALILPNRARRAVA